MIENRYHRYLNIFDYVPNVDFSQYKVDNLKWINFHRSLTLSDLNNDKIEFWFNNLGITTKWIEVFYTPPGDKGVIHSDNTIGAEWTKLIFQYGALGSTMRWWKSNNVFDVSTSIEDNSKSLMTNFGICNEDGDRIDNHYHGRVLVTKEESSEIIYETSVFNPSLINAGILHSSYNPTDERRFTITISLYHMDTMKRVEWDDAVQIFKKYIVN